MSSTPLVKLVRSTWERLFGRWNEGPEPPDRLAEIAIAFANSQPHATRKEWMFFASAHACESYRSGYLRGYEHSERESRDTTLPETIMDAIDPNWRWSPNILLVEPDRIVSNSPPTEAEEFEELLKRRRGE